MTRTEYSPEQIAIFERQAAKWSMLMRVMDGAAAGEIETTNIGAENHLRILANADGSLTLTVEDGRVPE